MPVYATVDLRGVKAAPVGQIVPADLAKTRVGAQLGKHRAGFHRRKLVLVAQQDDAGGVGHRFQQLRGQREIEHRGLVDHQRVDGQRVAGVVNEATGGCHPEQPVDGE